MSESAAESAARIQAVFAGDSGPARDIIIAKAAAALLVTGAESDPRAAADRAAKAITDKVAKNLLQSFVEFTRQLASESTSAAT